MANRTSQVDFKISRIAPGGVDVPLPCAFYESTPAFRWKIPEGVDQVAYCFEMRTFHPKQRMDGTYRCAYYNSGLVQSSANVHRLSFSMNTQTVDGIPSTVATWLGLCEIRLRLFDKNGNEYTSHEPVYDGTVYNFEVETVVDGNGDVIGETPKPQGRRWGTRDDGMYFVFDNVIDTCVNMNMAQFNFSLDLDQDSGQSLVYDLQISNTPLFGEGLMEDPVLLEASNVESSGASKNSLNASIDTSPGASERMETLENKPLPVLLPNKMYYFRARSFDGYDHSEWSRVNACEFIQNDIPFCEIINVDTPKILDTSSGELVEGDRPRGEMIVTFRIRDNDDTGVRAELCFSMETNEAEAANLNVLPNENGERLDYAYEDARPDGSKTKLIRARTVEPLIRIPTYRTGETARTVTVTWMTDKEMSGRKKYQVYLYLNAFDGTSQSNTSTYGPFTVDDSMIGDKVGSGVNNPPRFWTNGAVKWPFCRPILPDAMQRTMVAETSMYVPDEEEDEEGGDEMAVGVEDGQTGKSKKGGGRGHVESDVAEGGAAPGISVSAGGTGSSPNQTSTYNTAACPWHAAWKAYEDGTFLYETGKFDESGRPVTRYSDPSYGIGRITGTGSMELTEWAKYTVMKFVDYVDDKNVVHYIDNKETSLVKPEIIIMYDTDDGSPREVTTYVPDTEGDYYSYYAKTRTVQTGDGFVSYCEKCDTLSVLRTMVRKPGSDTLYDSVADAWPDGSYDGTPYELVFKCDNCDCDTVYEMSHRYLPDLSWSAWSFYKKPIFSYWYGYNRDGRPEYDQAMSLELAMTTEQEYNYLTKLWEKEHGKGEDAEKPPYSFVLMKRWYKDRPEWAPLESDEQYGLLYADTLLNLKHRPEFGPYMTVIPPRAKPYHFARYLDGLKLNACVKTDYMYGYEKKKADPENGVEADDGDPDLRKLAAQAPWAYPYMMSWQHYEGRVTMDKDAKGYAGADGSMGGVSVESDEQEDNSASTGGEGDGGEDGDGYLSQGSPVVEACFDMSNGCVAQGTPFESGENWYVRVYNRLSCAGTVQFPITIKRGINDRFLASVNGKEEFSGSVLPDGTDEMVIGFVYDTKTDGSHKQNSYATDFRNTCLGTMFGMAFDVAGADSLQFPDIEKDITSYNGIDLVAGTISYSLYGLMDDAEKKRPHPKEEQESSSSQEPEQEPEAGETEDDISIFAKYDRFIRTFELKPCENSCYKTFGLVPFKSFQSHAIYRDGDSPLLQVGTLPDPPSDGDGGPDGGSEGGSTGRIYAYTSVKRTKREYDCQESPMDNTIEDEYNVIVKNDDSQEYSGMMEAGDELLVKSESQSEFTGIYRMSCPTGKLSSYQGMMTSGNTIYRMSMKYVLNETRWVISSTYTPVQPPGGFPASVMVECESMYFSGKYDANSGSDGTLDGTWYMMTVHGTTVYDESTSYCLFAMTDQNDISMWVIIEGDKPDPDSSLIAWSFPFEDLKKPHEIEWNDYDDIYPVIVTADEHGQSPSTTIYAWTTLPAGNSLPEQLQWTSNGGSSKIVVTRHGNGVINIKKPYDGEMAGGEPMFTCYPDEVDRNGHHFRYTEEDFRKTGRIYVRRYHVETCNPFPMPGFGPGDEPGWRDWLAFPIPGKPGRYYKKKVIGFRGAPPVCRKIEIEFPDGTMGMDWAWFASDDPDAVPFSHHRKKVKQETDEQGNPKPVDPPPPYVRNDNYLWRNKLSPKTCVVFEYVDLHEALAKNLVEEQQGIPPLNHHAPFGVAGGTYGELAKRYGIYVMGGYDLTDDQKRQSNDGAKYEEDFSSCVSYMGDDGKVSSSWTIYKEMMPNNWRDRQINSVFHVDPADKASSASAIVLEVKGGSSSWTERGFNTMKKFSDAWSTAWDGKMTEPEENVIAASQLDENGNPKKKPYELSQYTVDQFSPMIGGRVGIYLKMGYQPEKRIGDYFKVDKNSIYGEKYIPFNSSVVHGTLDDPYLDYRLTGMFERERRLISDKSFQPVNELYTKAPYLDYRITGRIYGYYMYYFSGYPRSESPIAYANRPEPVYPYDRQWRILGEISGDESYDFGEFMYLQSEWNQYNRLHWRVAGSKNVVGILYATHLVNEGTAENPSYQPDTQTPAFSVRTKGSYWSDEKNAWLIPHTGSVNTDTIDTRQSQFVDGERYRFTMRFYGALNLQQQDVVITSTIFTTSRYAVSPATITGTSYDPWTKTLYITFRFDDALGRKYDVVGFQYILDDTNTDEDGRQSTNNSWITPGGGTGTDVLQGELLDLSSNMNGDNVPTESLIIKHTVRVNLSDLGVSAASSMRVRILSELSANRAGLTLPVFEARFWANEFLKPVEEDIMSLEGYETDWIWESDKNDPSAGKWVKSSEPVLVIGRIHESQSKLDEIDAEFESWYNERAQFVHPDMDAMEAWLNDTGQFDALYYGDAMDEYISEHDGYADSLDEYRMSHEELNENAARVKWLAVSGHDGEYASWFKANRNSLLKEIYNPVPQEFTSWAHEHEPSKNRMTMAIEYAKMRITDYRSYYGLDDTFGEESSSDSEVEESSAAGHGTETYDAEQATEETPSIIGFTVSGAGVESANGQYATEQEPYTDDDGNAQAIYSNGTFHLSFEPSMGWWWIGTERDWKSAIYVSVNTYDGMWESLESESDPAPDVSVSLSSSSDSSSESSSSESSEDESSSESSSSESSSSGEEHVMTQETAFEYVCSTLGRYNGFMSYYAGKCGYLDTRFDERCLVMRDRYGVETEGVCENSSDQAPVDPDDAASWAEWLDEHGSEYTNISDQYAEFLGGTSLLNRGRSAARQAFMSLQYGNGLSYSLAYQSIYSNLRQMKEDLSNDYAVKCRIETDHRSELVRQGYFCNGFEENTPFDGDKVNTCFRWRVETRPYEGSFDEVTSKNANGWQPRFDMYVRFQMDFLHTFDSQPGRTPLRDLLFIGGEGDNYRIRTGIQDVNYSARTTPDAQHTKANTVIVSDQITQRNKQLAAQSGSDEDDTTTSTTSQNMLQYVATWSLPKAILPGNVDGDSVPAAWEMAWEPDKGESITGERNAESILKDFRSAYYWRIAPYNLVDRPVFDTMTGTSVILDPLGSGPAPHAESVYRPYVIPTQEMIYHDAELMNESNDRNIQDWPEDEMAADGPIQHQRAMMFGNSYHSDQILAGTFDKKVHVAVAKLQVPVWKKNSKSTAFSESIPPYSNSLSHPGMENVLEKWINLEGLKKGIVQFTTDRPRQAVLPEESSSSSDDGPSFPESYSASINESVERYLITDYYTTVDGNDYPIYKTGDDQPSFLYKCKYNNQYSMWIIGYSPKNHESEPAMYEPTNIRYLCYDAEMPDGEDADWRTAYGEHAAITVSPGESQEKEPSIDVSGGTIEFIDDNIGNYNTEWIPFTPIRRKPVVVKINSQYVMLTNKTRRIVKLSRTVNGETETLDFPESVIMLSRGFSSDVFGEERVCFPKYSYETLDSVLEGAISFDGQSVCLTLDGKWRMHFNAAFNDNGTIRREIWKADTTDFEEWTDFAKITVMNGSSEEFNVLEPFVCIVGNAYEMYASSRRQGESYMTIKRYSSQDGSTYSYSGTVTIRTDGAMDFTSPYVVNLDATHRRMYLRCRTLPTQQTPATASVIASIESDGGNWNETSYSENTSRLVVEKSNSSSRIPYPVDFKNDQFMWPCVIVDTDGGMPVLRMYYNTFDDPYVWHGGQLKKTSGASELSIRTEYLEMYAWRTESLYASMDEPGSTQAVNPVMSTDLEAGFDPYGQSVWTPLEKEPDPEDQPAPGETQNLPPDRLPAGKWIRYEWWSKYRDCLGAKITTGSMTRLVQCLSQGPWLWFGNAGSTSAILRPEMDDPDYDPEAFTPGKFINENNLQDGYQSWLQLHDRQDSQDAAVEYLIESKSYPQYMWWARKGPGIYRYVGWELMKNYTWDGDVIPEPSSSSSSSEINDDEYVP